MSSPAESSGEQGGARLEATATGQATVNQAGRDQHFHFSTGTRRVLPGGGTADVGCPYPGLAPFSSGQAGWFFGRDRLTAILVSRLDGCLTEGGPVMVVAASGAGKSSLLRAGLLPKAAAGALTPAGSRHWPQVVFTPGAHPLQQAAAALAAACPSGGEVPAAAGPGELDALLAQAAELVGPGTRVIVVVDQFEELFRLCEDESERSAFISWLCRAAGTVGPDGPTALAVCAVRADFYPDCARYPPLRQALQDNQVIVGAMSPEELREAVTAPAEAAGLDIEPGLTELLLADLGADARPAGNGRAAGGDDGAGRLPLLAHVLRATWQERHGSTLTVAGYRAAGGIDHAVAETAERVYARLGAASQHETRALFLRLVKVGDAAGEDIRRPLPSAALAAGAATEAAAAFTASRLMTQSRETVRITHEALLRAWPRLAAWLDDDRAGHLVRQRLEEDASEWDLARRDSSLLYRGSRLGTAVEWAGGHLPDLTVTARSFLAASRRRARRTSVAVRAGVAALAALALATTVVSVVALQQRSVAVSQRDSAVYNQVLAEAGQLESADPSAAAQFLAAAYRMRQTTDLRARLVSTENESLPVLEQTGSSLASVAAGPGGRVIATASSSEVTLWDLSSPARPRQIGHPFAAGFLVDSIAVSPDGRTLAVGYGDGTLTLWDIATPVHPRKLATPETRDVSRLVTQVTFSPDGRTLASVESNSATYTGTVRLWNVASPGRPRQMSRLGVDGQAGVSLGGRLLAVIKLTGAEIGAVTLWDISAPGRLRKAGQAIDLGGSTGAVALSGDGRIMAVCGQDGGISLWDVARPQRPGLLSRSLSAGDTAVALAVFSADGQTLATVSVDGTVSRWDISSPAQPRPLGQPMGTGNTNVFAAAVSPDGLALVTGSEDGAFTVLPLSSSEIKNAYHYSSGIVFSPDGRLLASDNGEGVLLWNVSDPSQPRPEGKIEASSGDIASLPAFSPDGRLLAVQTAIGPGAISLWDVTNPARPRELGHLSGEGATAFSPDGRTLATGNTNGNITLSDITDPAHPRAVGTLLDDNDLSPVESLQFTQGGNVLVGEEPGGIYLWRPSTRQTASVLGSDTFPLRPAVSSNGRTLAVVDAYSNGDQVGVVTLWDISRPDSPRQIGKGQASGATSLAFSPDGRTLATITPDSAITLWDVSTPSLPQQAGQALSSSAGTIEAVTFSPRANTFATTSPDGTVELWDLDVRYALDRICRATTITSQQWRRYLSQVPYQPACPQ